MGQRIESRRRRAFHGGWSAARKGNLTRLPIAEPDDETRAANVDSYLRCVAATAELAAAEGTAADLAARALSAATAQFDRLVDDLYDLTYDERALIRT